MAVSPVGLVAAGGARARRLWLAATVAVTVAPLAVLPVVAPGASAHPIAGLGWALFVGSSVHVAATGWFYSVPEVRSHMRAHPGRFFYAPAALLVAGAALAVLLSTRELRWVLLGFFAWQFFHFQKQNLGVAALAARAHHTPPLTRAERAVIIAAGAAGIGGLLGRPALLQIAGARAHDLLFHAAAGAFAAAFVTGVLLLGRRATVDRPAANILTFGTALLFFAPVFLFTSPYAAVAGMTIAHGMQYLLLVGMLAAQPVKRNRRWLSVLIFIDVAVLLGLVLNRTSHMHDAPGMQRALFGVYLGLSAAHFVIDAGMWRLRDAFPRQFLTERLPFLLAPERI